MGTDNVHEKLVLKTIISPPRNVMRSLLDQPVGSFDVCTCNSCLADSVAIVVRWDVENWQNFRINPSTAGYLIDKYSVYRDWRV